MFGKKKKQQEELEDLSIQPEQVQTLEDKEDGGFSLDMEDVPKKKKKLPVWVIIPVLALVIIIPVVFSKFSSPKAVGKAYEVVQVEKGDITEVFNTSGKVESEKTKKFYSPVNAPVQTCNAKVGKTVKAGEMMIAFDTKDLEMNNQQSQLSSLSTQYSNDATVEQSNQSAAAAEEAKAQAEQQTASARTNLENQIAEKEAQINELTANAEDAAAGYQVQLTDFNSQVSEYKGQINDIQQVMQANLTAQNTKTAEKENKQRAIENIDLQYPNMKQEEKDELKKKLLQETDQLTEELADLKSDYIEAEQKVAAIQQELTQYQAKAPVPSDAASALAVAQQELSALQSSLSSMNATGGGTTSANTGITGSQKKSMQVAEDLAQLAVLTSEELVAKGREGIKAEFDGVISDVQTLEGSTAAQGMELFTLASNKDVAVKLQVSVDDFEKLKVGNKATITIGGNKYEGTLTNIDKIATKNEKGNPVIGAQIHITSPDENVYIGVNSKVAMTVAEVKDVLSLPSDLVNTSTKGDFVYVIKDGVVKEQVVELGIASDSKVEVISGLKEGDEVISEIGTDIAPGTKATAKKGTEKK